jgi:LysR family hydrogen peroxide-inducible transcriptional activator
MNLRDLQYLVAVADHRHFGQAAEASFVSQPTLSTQIKKLERELGAELIERTPRQVTLTEAGERVVQHARRVLGEVDTIRSIGRQASDPESGTLRLGLFPTLAPYLLPHVVPEIHARFANLELLLVEEKTDVVLSQLRDGRLDAGVLALPVPGDQLHAEPLFTEQFVLAAPVGHPLAASGEPIPVASLADQDMLLLEEGHCLRDHALSVCKMTGASERRGFRATSLETLRQMVSAGVGVTLLPELAVQAPVATSPDITLVRFTDPVPSRDVAMFWRSTSVFRDVLPDIAALVRDQVTPLVGGALGASVGTRHGTT